MTDQRTLAAARRWDAGELAEMADADVLAAATLAGLRDHIEDDFRMSAFRAIYPGLADRNEPRHVRLTRALLASAGIPKHPRLADRWRAARARQLMRRRRNGDRRGRQPLEFDDCLNEPEAAK